MVPAARCAGLDPAEHTGMGGEAEAQIRWAKENGLMPHARALSSVRAGTYQQRADLDGPHAPLKVQLARQRVGWELMRGDMGQHLSQPATDEPVLEISEYL